ncbi:MAG: MG2 domain-containing protein [Planctomycetota bacterium]
MRAHRSIPVIAVLVGLSMSFAIVDATPQDRFAEAERLFAEKSYRSARDIYFDILGDADVQLSSDQRGQVLAHLAACHEGLRDWNALGDFLQAYELPGFPWNAHILQTVGRRTGNRHGGWSKLDALNSALKLFAGGGDKHRRDWCGAAFDKINALQRSWQYDYKQQQWEDKYGGQEEPNVPWELWRTRRGEETDQKRREDALALYEKIVTTAPDSDLIARALLERGMFRIHSLGNSRGSWDTTPKIEDLIARIEDEAAREQAAEWLAAVGRGLDDWREVLRRFPNDGRADDACFLIAYATENYVLDLVAAIPRYQKLIDTYPESQWAESAAGRIQHIQQEHVRISAPPHFATGTAPVLEARARNVTSLICRLYPIDNPLNLLQRNTEALAIPDDADHISWSTKTGCTPDHKQRTFPIVVPEERPGAYLLRVAGTDRQIETVILISDLAMTTHMGIEEAIAWVTDSGTGQPRANADVMFRLDTRHGRERVFKTHRARTDADGVARWRFPKDFTPAAVKRSVRVTTATQLGNHVTLSGSTTQWQNSHRKPRWIAYVESDRPAYRPEQTAHFKVTCRYWDGAQYTEAKAGEGFSLKIMDPRDQAILEDNFVTDANGAISGSVALSPESPLGNYKLQLHKVVDGGTKRVENSMVFRVEEYRMPEFEVQIETPDEPLLVGDPLQVKVRGRFLAGDPVRSGAVRIKVTRSPLHFRFDKPRRYSWYHPRNEHSYWNQEDVFSAEGNLDAEGNATFDVPTAEFPDAKDSTYHVSAWITDDAEREEAATRPLPVTHTEFFAHLDPEVEIYAAGEQLQIAVRSIRPDQEPIASSGEVEIARRRDREVNTDEGPTVRTEWEPILTTPFSVGLEPKMFSEVIDEPGQFRITYRTRDRRENAIEASTYVWVLTPAYTGRGYKLQGIQILTSAREYAIGDTIRGAVVCEAPDAEVLLLRSGGGLFVDVQTIRARGHVAQFEFPATSADTPNFFLTAIVVRNGDYFRTQRGVLVPPEHVFLEGELSSNADEVRPGDSVALQLKVRDHDGRPVAGTFSLTLYDEAIHAIQPEFRASTLEHFYGKKWDFDLRHVYSTRFKAPTNGRWLDNEPRKYRNRNLPSRFRSWRYQFPFLSPMLAAAFAEPSQGWGADAAPTSAAAPTREMAKGKAEGKRLGRRRGALAENSRALYDSEEADEAGSLSLSSGDDFQGDGGEGGAPEKKKPRLRSRFDETAVWKSSFATAADGLASLEVTMPDSLTRWIGIARGMTADGRVLEARLQMRTTQRILARLAAPRFFRERDEVVVSALVRSRFAEELDGTIELQFPSSILEPIGAADTASGRIARSVKIPAKGEARIDVPFRVIGTGEVVLSLVANTPREGDALERRIPALRYGLDRSITGAGVVLDVEGTTQAEWDFIVPEESVAATRTLQINCTASPAIALIESLPYLVRYPYGCVEQTLHRFLPAAVVAQTLQATGVKLDEILPEEAAQHPTGYWGHLQTRPLELFRPGDLQKLLTAGDARLQAAQNGDGSWGWWAGAPGDPYITALVVDAYATALGAGVDLPRRSMTRGAQWLLIHLNGRDLAGEAQIYDRPDFEEFAMVGRALFRAHQVLNVDGSASDANDALQHLAGVLYGFRDRLGPQGKALLALGIAALEIDGDERPQVLLRNLRNHEIRKPEWGTTHFGQRRNYSWWFDSGVEATARTLEAFLAIQPDDPRVREMVRWLIENRQGSHYDSTKSTAAVAFALAGYLQKSGELLANMKVDVVLNDKVIGSFDIRREELFTRRHNLVVPSAPLYAGGHKLQLRRQGQGELYWDATLSFYSQEDPIPAGGHRLAVERRYFQLVDTPSEREEVYYENGLERRRMVPTTTRSKIPLPVGAELQPGDRVLVEVEVDSPQNFRYLMFTDHKPSGLEALAVRSGYVGGVFSYREFRDDRVLHFASRLPEGKTQFAYELRAERPGRFRALPVVAEAMYLPHIHANSEGAAFSVDTR